MPSKTSRSSSTRRRCLHRPVPQPCCLAATRRLRCRRELTPPLQRVNKRWAVRDEHGSRHCNCLFPVPAH
jgi:hypothetical protein